MKNKFNKFLMIILSILFICSSFFTGCENFNNSNNSNNNGNSNVQEVNPYDRLTSDVLYYGTLRGILDFVNHEYIEVDGKLKRRYIVEENSKYDIITKRRLSQGATRAYFDPRWVKEYDENLFDILPNGFATKEVNEDTCVEMKLKRGTYTCNLYLKIIDTTDIENINSFSVYVNGINTNKQSSINCMEPICDQCEYDVIIKDDIEHRRYIISSGTLITIFPTVTELDGKARFISGALLDVSSKCGEVETPRSFSDTSGGYYYRNMDLAIIFPDVTEETEREVTFTYKDFSTTVYFLQKPTQTT